MNPKIILIHPPVAKPSEPPAGIAKLAGCLKANNLEHRVIDANLEGILCLLQKTVENNTATDRWTMRACKNLERNLCALQNIVTYSNKSRYSRAVMDVNHVLNITAKSYDVNLSLSDYVDRFLSPVKSDDLIHAAGEPQKNPFYLYFQPRLTLALNELPEFIGFSVNYLSQALCAFAMIGFIKRINPQQKIILGGSLITSWVAQGMGIDKFQGLINEIVPGAGEEKLLQLLGISNGQIKCPPDYSDFPAREYFAPGFILPYSASRGCYWRKCAFCPEKSENNFYLPLSHGQVGQELPQLVEKYQPVLLHILDNAISPAMLNFLAQNPPGAPWYGFARVSRELADINFCMSLKKSGCVMLKLGIESGDQDVLDKLNKGIDLSLASAALRTLKKTGVTTYVYLLFGTPPENDQSAKKTLEFVVEHSDCINFLNLAIFNLPAGSAEAQKLETDDFYEGDLSLYKSFRHPLGWHRPLVRNFLEKTFKKHSAVAPILKRMPEFFTSNHAPFFILNNDY